MNKDKKIIINKEKEIQFQKKSKEFELYNIKTRKQLIIDLDIFYINMRK